MKSSLACTKLCGGAHYGLREKLVLMKRVGLFVPKLWNEGNQLCKNRKLNLVLKSVVAQFYILTAPTSCLCSSVLPVSLSLQSESTVGVLSGDWDSQKGWDISSRTQTQSFKVIKGRHTKLNYVIKHWPKIDRERTIFFPSRSHIPTSWYSLSASVHVDVTQIHARVYNSTATGMQSGKHLLVSCIQSFWTGTALASSDICSLSSDLGRLCIVESLNCS